MSLNSASSLSVLRSLVGFLKCHFIILPHHSAALLPWDEPFDHLFVGLRSLVALAHHIYTRSTVSTVGFDCSGRSSFGRGCLLAAHPLLLIFTVPIPFVEYCMY